jgi:2-C-methyl-D-erythritol 4-phosphate cytidylyltransferase
MAVALIVAAGRGERLGGRVPKALVELAGRPMLSWSLAALHDTPAVGEIVVAMPPHAGAAPPVLAPRATPVRFVDGGDSRSQSVLRALLAAGEDEIVLVHDAARPLLTPGLAVAVIDALLADEAADGAIAAAAVSDTIKRAGGDRVVSETLPRSELWAVQTPQVFRREALQRALEADPAQLAAATDDAALVERAGGRVIVVPAEAENLKITTALDLQLAELLLARRAGEAAEPA